MARLRYNGLTGTLGAALTNSATAVTFGAALTHAGGVAVPTIASPDYLPLTILDSSGNFSEIVYLTAYTAGATTGTITRAAEGAGTAVAHSSGDKFVHGATATDIVGTYSGGSDLLALASATDTLSVTLTTSFADITGLTTTFTVPTNGSVEVTVAGAFTAQASSAIEINLRDSGGDIAGSGQRVAYSTSASQGRFAYRYLLTGLTPGATKTLKVGGRYAGGSTPNTIERGDPFGASVIEVRGSTIGTGSAPTTTTSGLLGSAVYSPGTAASYSTTGPTVVDLDATNLAVTFTAPASGKVKVTLTGNISVPNWTGAVPQWGVREGTTTLAQRDLTWQGNISSELDIAMSTSFVITGLTPGSTHTYKWAACVRSGAASFSTSVGGVVGPAIMEVSDAGVFNPLLTPIGGTTTIGGLLGSTTYNPAASQDLSTVSTTSVDADATNLKVTFTAPGSGKVLVRMASQATSSSASGATYWCLRDSNGDVAGSAEAVAGGSGDYARHTYSNIITGLTPGTSYTWKWGHYASGATSHIYIGGGVTGAGPAVMEVYDGGTYTPVSGPTATFGEAAWTTPTLLNSWVNYGSGLAPAGFRKDGSGVVHLRGTIKSGTIGQAAFTLPVGYRPEYNSEMLSDNSGAPGANPPGVISVQPSGNVVIGNGGNGYVYLDGVSFYAGDTGSSTALIVDGGTP